VPLQEFSPQGILARQEIEVLLRHTMPFNLTGSPTISLPCGVSSEGLPISLQLIGRHDDEGLVMRAGHAYEQATKWHERRPAV
jgi:amidase